jgi:hypothetical protein
MLVVAVVMVVFFVLSVWHGGYCIEYWLIHRSA